MEQEYCLSIGLYDPGMTWLHRAGLAGLYMTLKKFGATEGEFESIGFRLNPQRVELSWKGNGLGAFDKLLNESFGITSDKPDGLIDFLAHHDMGAGEIQRIELTGALRSSFLQHNKQNRIPKGTSNRSTALSLGDEQIVVEYRPFVERYAHATAADTLLDKKGKMRPHIKIKGWLFPGAAERHSTLTGTEMEESPERWLCLLFAPVASLYYRLSHRRSDGQYDRRRGVAVCVPHINDLERYSHCFKRWLQSPVDRLSADGPGDAGLSALLALRAEDPLDKLEVTGCSVFIMGSVPWSKQQSSRTAVSVLEGIDETMLDLFEVAVRCIPNRLVIRKDETRKRQKKSGASYFVATSLSRGLIGDNIAHKRRWYEGFHNLMCSQELARRIGFEREGLKEMVKETVWPDEADRKMVEAVHAAIRNRYGALAARATKRGEVIRFDREFERMRTGLMRAKNASTLRAEIADLFARGGVNKVLQSEWKEILPLFTGGDWQRTRDLALLALASYTGKGAEEIEQASAGVEEESEA